MKTYIEINGRKYDAKTGKLMKNQPVTTPSKTKQLSHKGWFIDGIRRRTSQQPSATHQAAVPVQPAYQAPVIKSSPAPKPPRGSVSTKTATRSPEKPKTLLRTIVKKPASAPDIHSASMPIAEPANVLKSAAASQPALAAVKTHLHTIAKSPSISRFGDMTKTSYTRVVNSLSVVAQKVPEAAPPIFGKKHYKKGAKPQVFNHRVVNPHYQTKSRSEHMAKRLSRRIKGKSKAMAVAASVLAVICLGGFLAYQSIPSFAMRIAARGAGFSGQLPGEIPDGYSYSGIQYTKGEIVLNYHSNSDKRQFSIIQQPQLWTSESLLINFVTAKDDRPLTSTDDGLTFYIYNDGNVTWVDNGIWFNVTSDGSLSSDQLIEIASSFWSRQ